MRLPWRKKKRGPLIRELCPHCGWPEEYLFCPDDFHEAWREQNDDLLQELFRRA